MVLLKVLRQVVQAVQPMVRKVEGHMKAWTKPCRVQKIIRLVF